MNEEYRKKIEKRKQEAINRHNKKKAEGVIKKRKKLQYEYAILKKQHIEASKELSSGNRNISNRAFRNWNTSIYKYDNKLNHTN